MRREKNARWTRLDQFTLDIEFLLISVIQGVALAALAANATPIFSSMQLEYLLYPIAGFLFILIFWSGAVIHSISFIDWPLDLTHNFLYFLTSFFEVLAFSFMQDPIRWFAFVTIFFAAAEALYIADLTLVKHKKWKFAHNDLQKNIYVNLYKQQSFGMKVVVPLGILYNLLAFTLISIYPETFIQNKLHIALIGLQIVFSVFFLIDLVRKFSKRAVLLDQLIK